MRTCKGCGREYRAKGPSQYCPECRHKKWVCRECGKEFEIAHNDIFRDSMERGYAFCSRQCANKYNGRNRPPELKAQISKKIHTTEIAEKRRRTFQERYGVDCAFQLPEVKEKANAARSPEMYEKAKKTFQERYGVDCAFQIPEVRERTVKGVHSKEANAKRRQTMIERYGYPTTFEDPEQVKKIVEKAHTPEANKKRSESLKKVWAERHDEIIAKRGY